jgi:ABC-type glycerol-3-phosphate transport system substrate-binding protein
MKKIYKVTLGSLLSLGIALTGCSSGSNSIEQLNKTAPAKASTEKKELRFLLRGNANEPVNKMIVEDLKTYEQKNPNVSFKYEYVAVADLETKLNAAFAGGTAPDLFDIGIVLLAGRAQLKQFAPLDEYVKKWEDSSDIYENTINQGKFKGSIYGIGHAPAPYFFAYRKDFFQEAGLDPNKPPQNWAELKEYAAKLVKKDKDQVIQGGFDVPKQNDSLIFEVFARQNGNDIVDETNELPLFDQPSAKEALEYLVSMLPYSIPYSDHGVVDNIPFLKGKSAMSYVAPENIQQMFQNDPSLKDKIGFVSNVPGKKAATFGGLRLLTMSSTSKNKDEAWEVIKHLMSKEILSKRMKEIKIAPVRKSLAQEFVSMDPLFNKATLDAIAIGYSRPSVTWSPLYRKYTQQAYEQALFNVKTPEEALKEAVVKLKQEIGK